MADILAVRGSSERAKFRPRMWNLGQIWGFGVPKDPNFGPIPAAIHHEYRVYVTFLQWSATRILSVMAMFRQLRPSRTLLTSRVFIDLTYFQP